MDLGRVLSLMIRRFETNSWAGSIRIALLEFLTSLIRICWLGYSRPDRTNPALFSEVVAGLVNTQSI